MKYLKIIVLFFVSIVTLTSAQAGPVNSPESALRQKVLDKLSVGDWDVIESGAIVEAAIYFTVDVDGHIHVQSVQSAHNKIARKVAKILDNKIVSVEGLDTQKSYIIKATIRKE